MLAPNPSQHLESQNRMRGNICLIQTLRAMLQTQLLFALRRSEPTSISTSSRTREGGRHVQRVIKGLRREARPPAHRSRPDHRCDLPRHRRHPAARLRGNAGRPLSPPKTVVPKSENGLQAIDYQRCSNSNCGSWVRVGGGKRVDGEDFRSGERGAERDCRVVSFRCGVLPSCRRGSSVKPSQPGEVL
jgi:hypothetical protein